MKILFLGDSSNYHNSVAGALVRLGHKVTVASAGSGWMQTGRDINLYRGPGLWNGLKLCLRMHRLCLRELKGYDVVQLHDPIFVQLKPHRLKPIFEKIKKGNGSIFLTSLANDTPYVRMCLNAEGPLRYNEYRVEGKPTPYAREHPEIERAWTNPPLSDFTRYIHDNVDGCLTALYEYHLGMRETFGPDRLAYAGIPIDMPADIIPSRPIGEGPIRILAACHKGREKEKGFDVLLSAIREVVAASPGIAEIEMAQNMPFIQFRKKLTEAHIVVDQLYSYTPATTALMAMACGNAVISGGEEEYYRFIGENELRPIINPDPTDIPAFQHRLCALLTDHIALQAIMRQGPSFVAKHNSADLVARRMLALWEKTNA